MSTRPKPKPKAKRAPGGYSRSLYYQQPDGSWKRGGDGRSNGLTLAQVRARKGRVR